MLAMSGRVAGPGLPGGPASPPGLLTDQRTGNGWLPLALTAYNHNLGHSPEFYGRNSPTTRTYQGRL